MGLRINTNTAALSAIRNLSNSDRLQSRSLERLSSGLRINSAADDPSGLVISEQLRAQIVCSEQALDNSQNASNLIGTAEAALTEVHTLLIGLRESVIYALNAGSASPEQISAEQDAVDAAIQAINRIAKTTRFGTKSLLNGRSGFKLDTTVQSAGLTTINLRSVAFGGQSQVDYYLQQAASAQRASMTFPAFVVGSAGDPTSGWGRFRVTGYLGSETVTLPQGASHTDIQRAVNLFQENTGVYMSEDGGGDLVLLSVHHGSRQSATIAFVDGTVPIYTSGDKIAASGPLATVTDVGADVVAFINGVKTAASGLNVTVVSPIITGDVVLSSIANATYTFRILRSGLDFQLNSAAQPSDLITVGIDSVEPLFLGEETITLTRGVLPDTTKGGYLDTLMRGCANDLINDPTNATYIVDKAISDISDIRAYLGALGAYVIDSNTRSLGTAIENLKSSESDIRDLNFAAETAEFTRTQILFQAGTAVLASANMIPQTILSLLQ